MSTKTLKKAGLLLESCLFLMGLDLKGNCPQDLHIQVPTDQIPRLDRIDPPGVGN
jgi:hypothetical protein